MQILLVFVQALHLLIIGVGACLPITVVLLNRKLFHLNDESHKTAIWHTSRKLLGHSLVAILIGSVLGLLLAGVIWSDEYHHRCHLVMSRFKWAAVEWLFSVGIYIGVLRQWRKTAGGITAFWVRSLLLLLASLNLLYHFPFLFMVIRSIPDDQVITLTNLNEQLSGEAFRAIAFTATHFSRWLHASLAMLTVTFVYTSVNCIFMANQYTPGAQRDSAISICRWCARNVLLTMLAQLAFGGCVLITMSRTRVQSLLGNNVPATILFVAGIVLFFIQLQQWTALMGERIDKRQLIRAISTFITLFLCMVAVSVLI